MMRLMDNFELRRSNKDRFDRERKKWFIAAREHREKKELKEDRAEQDAFDLASGFIVADPVEVEEFKVELSTYDAATIAAIQKNQEVLEGLYHKRDAMLEQAHVLEDGTRVFKSEDGQRVYDEHGNLVSRDIIHPDEIADHLPNAEPYLDLRSHIQKHEAIGQSLHDYQSRLDDARERLDSGKLSQDEFEEIRDDLRNNMPIEARRELPDYDPSQEYAQQAAAKSVVNSNFENAATARVEQAATVKLTPADMAIDPSLMPMPS